MFLDKNLQQTRDIKFSKTQEGTVDKILEYDGFILVISIRVTGTLPQPPEISSIWYSTELVYSGYDNNGKLLWQEAFDNTPERYKNPQENWSAVVQ